MIRCAPLTIRKIRGYGRRIRGRILLPIYENKRFALQVKIKKACRIYKKAMIIRFFNL